jgi:hypothetical protein
MTFIGYFDLIGQNHAIGWALIPKQISERVTIEIIDGGGVIGSGIANNLHKGLKEKT